MSWPPESIHRGHVNATPSLTPGNPGRVDAAGLGAALSRPTGQHFFLRRVYNLGIFNGELSYLQQPQAVQRLKSKKPLLATYQQRLFELGYSADSAQFKTIRALEPLFGKVKANLHHGIWSKWLARLQRRKITPGGLYIWGKVGRGKTFLLDVFYESLALKEKRKLHFHQFMQENHSLLKTFGKRKSPLQLVAMEHAKNNKIIFLDEFQVTDIVDAVILGELLPALHARGIFLLLSSNTKPDDLYLGGLQRERFLPAIQFMQKQYQVVNLNGMSDHRLNLLSKNDIFMVPNSRQNRRTMANYFKRLSNRERGQNKTIELRGRIIPVIESATGTIWFDFEILCGGPRSVADYLEIANRFTHVLLSGVPVLTQRDDVARRFINLIDTLYERQVKLLTIADVPPRKLCTTGRLSNMFHRTASRLNEMRSRQYLAKSHVRLGMEATGGSI